MIRSLIHKLFEIGAVKFGEFKLKSGITSPIYIDLRLTISNPKLIVTISELMHEAIRGCKMDLICGVPYTALPFATAISIQHTIPMVLRRKEKKEYGTGKLIEGIYQPGQQCVIIEDVITSGQSIFETIVPLSKEGLVVEDIVVLVDREQGGRKYIESKGFKVHPICTITMIVDELLKEKKINEETAHSVQDFIRKNQV
ncbi:MAG: orotate phosphoribosyltransferase [Chlamydiae bacterium CG10_big_fil_rev_8_21_14_0_10_42_34]|nr:MAG: orotate phosphoribosyltransferase [Chlamydiae bacterium CG10_big_fil_rev_8_21_14_0_10_42_34]